MEEIKLKLRVRTGTCKECRSSVESYHLSDFTYGERLLLTKDGMNYSYINLLEDKVYNEVEKIICIIMNESNTNLSKAELANYLRKVFYLACDTINGVPIETARGTRRCPNCGTQDIEFGAEDTGFCAENTFNVVSHNDWNKLSETNKVKLIENELLEIEKRLEE